MSPVCREVRAAGVNDENAFALPDERLLFADRLLPFALQPEHEFARVDAVEQNAVLEVKGCDEVLKFFRHLAKPALMRIPPPNHRCQQLPRPVGIAEGSPEQGRDLGGVVNPLQGRNADDGQPPRRPNGHPRERGARPDGGHDHVEPIDVPLGEDVLRPVDAQVVRAALGHDPRVAMRGAQFVEKVRVGFFPVGRAADGNERHAGSPANGHDLGFLLAAANDADGPDTGAPAGEGRREEVVREGAAEGEQRPRGLSRRSLEVQSELEALVALRTLGVQQIEAADGEGGVGEGLV